jgi:hypothetical protein
MEGRGPTYTGEIEDKKTKRQKEESIGIKGE